MKVKCINVKPMEGDNLSIYPGLILDNLYTVIQSSSKSYRIISTLGEPVSFDRRRFEIIDSTVDENCVVESNDDGTTWFRSPEISDYGHLFEDYHDYKEEAIRFFDNYMIKKFVRENGELEAIISHPQKKYFGRTPDKKNRYYCNHRYNNVTIIDVRCINDLPMDQDIKLYPDLCKGNIYTLLGYEGDYYRMLGDLGKPYLYHKSRFEIFDTDKGDKCVKMFKVDIGEMSYPALYFFTEFFEDYFLYDPGPFHEILNYSSSIKLKKFDKIRSS